MGQLSLSAGAVQEEESGTIQTATGVERLHGKKLATELHIVLENITHGFKKPNVLDLKLGAQLWENAANAEKRARLDKVSNSTTSSSLGFRIAGMRTWKGASAPEVDDEIKELASGEDGFWVYNKMYGRVFDAENVKKGFESYVYPQGKEQEQLERAREVLAFFLGEVKDIQDVFERKESRMYGASILLVYEGDLDEYNKTKETLRSYRPSLDEEEDEEEDLPKLAAVKMIDFAHASWHPGEGSDENAIRGMRSTVKILKDLLDQTEKELEQE